MDHWTMHRQQQQKGAQIQRGKSGAPAEAVRGREAQDHDAARQDAAPGEPPLPPGAYPASSLPNSKGDKTPSVPDDGDPSSDWDNVVQPEQAEDARAPHLRRERAADQEKRGR